MTMLALLVACSNTTKPSEATLGSISFTPTGAEDALPHFERGLLLLHSFEYDDARKHFIKARDIDPDFVMACWGEAMTYNHPLWSAQYNDDGVEALNRLAPTPEERQAKAQTGLERDFMIAVDILFTGEGDKLDRDRKYYEHMKEMHRKYSDNNEVAAFYALSILGSSPERDPEVYERGAVIAQGILKENPEHPGALHYLIHSYDDPAHAHLALNAADNYSVVAPDAGHALHMPSHIYVALGMWDEVISSNIASFEASNKRKEKLDLDNNARNYHALQWLMYGYLQRGENEKARDLLADMQVYHDELPSSRARAYLTMMRAGYLADVDDYSDPIVEVTVNDTDLNVSIRAMNLYVQGRNAYLDKDPDALQATIDTMANIRGSEYNRMMQRGAAMCSGVNWTAQLPTETDVNNAHIMEMELEALRAVLNTEEAAAQEWFEKAVALEDETSYMFGPPTVAKPAHELYAEWLLAQGQFAKAKEHVDLALEKTPGRRVTVLLKDKIESRASTI